MSNEKWHDDWFERTFNLPCGHTATITKHVNYPGPDEPPPCWVCNPPFIDTRLTSGEKDVIINSVRDYLDLEDEEDRLVFEEIKRKIGAMPCY